MITIYRSETSASLRRVPMWLVASDGTSAPSSQAAGQPQINWLARGAATINTAATLSAVSVNGGEYYIELNASEVSCLGVASVQYRAAAVCPSSTYFQITNLDSGNSYDVGLAAWSGVSIHAGIHSGATIQGVTRVNSGVTLNADTHSGATIQGLTLLNSSVTLNATEYSAVTVRIGIVDYSGATVGVNNFARSSMQSMADRFLLRALASGSDAGRLVQDAFRVLRNKVAIGGSTMTVYTEDDATSAWTASVTTSASANPIVSIDPGGP